MKTFTIEWELPVKGKVTSGKYLCDGVLIHDGVTMLYEGDLTWARGGAYMSPISGIGAARAAYLDCLGIEEKKEMLHLIDQGFELETYLCCYDIAWFPLSRAKIEYGIGCSSQWRVKT